MQIKELTLEGRIADGDIVTAWGSVTFDDGENPEELGWQALRSDGTHPIAQVRYPDDSERVSEDGARGVDGESDPYIVAVLSHETVTTALAQTP